MLKIAIVTLGAVSLLAIAVAQAPGSALAAPKSAGANTIGDPGIKPNSIGDPSIKVSAKYRFCQTPKIIVNGKCDCPQDRCFTSGPCGPSYWMNKRRRPC
jgi:hypothetical protein